VSDISSQDLDALPEAEALLVERQCNLFEAAWQSAGSGGPRPRIEDYLAGASEPVREILLVELIALDIAYRRLRGEDPQPDEYLRCFPKLSPARLAEAMAARQTSPLSTSPDGDKVDGAAPGETIRCPHCHNPIRLSDCAADEVLCPACGSTFRIQDSRPTSTTAQMQRLGKFQLLERVGLGAFGAVWKARPPRLRLHGMRPMMPKQPSCLALRTLPDARVEGQFADMGRPAVG
jgi:hypothetical protein